MKRGARGLGPAASLVLMAASAFGADRWVEYRIGPFHLISNAGDKAAREKLNQLEQLRFVLGYQLGKIGMGKTGLDTVWPIDIVLFANQREYLSHTLGKVSQPFIPGGSATLSAWTSETAFPHEMLKALARLLIDDNAARMPETLETALCDLFSTIQATNTHVKLGAPPSANELPPDRMRMWAKMQMLATLPDYSGKLRVYINNIQQTGDEGVAVRNAFDLTPAKLDTLLDAYIKAGKFEAAPVPGEPLDPNRDFPEKPLDKAFIDGLLAEFAADGKNFPPDSPRGLLAKNTHASLELAAKANPKWAEPQAKLAALETNSLEKMKELKAAATLDPRNASYWRALAEAQAAADDYAGAAKSWSLAEHAAADEAERAKIHIAKMALDAARADFTEAEKQRRIDEAARDLARVKAAAAAEVHAAEAASRERMNAGKAPYQKPVEWFDEPAGVKVEGKLIRVDCLNGGPMKLTVQQDGGALVKVLVRDLKRLTVDGTNEARFVCGIAKPARKIKLSYQAKPDAKLGTLGDVLVVEFP